MLSNNRLAKLLPVATILITGAIGLIFNSMLSVSVQSADTATANRNNLEIVSNNLVNFRRLEKALDSLETHRSSSNVRYAQHLYQLLQNDLRVAAANGQPAGTQDQTHLQDLFADAAAELTPVKKQLLAISAEIARGDAAAFAGRIGNIRATIDTVTRRLVENGNMPFPSQNGNEASQYAGTAIILAFLALSILLAGMLRKGKFGKFRFDLAQRIEEIDGVIKTDSLTGLPGREAFLEFVNDAFYSKTPNSDFGLIILKVVGLKSINFEFGYSFGDELIVRLGKELADYVERLDSRNCISRTGSAEFSFVIYDVEDDVELSILGHMLLAIVNTPHSRDGFFATLNGCVGVAGMDSDLLSARELILRADLAMQEARKQGANEAATYKRPLRTNQIRKRKIEDDLQSAIEAKQIYPVYQPQFDMVSGKMVGMEALARWDHPELGAIPPLEFIEAAERVGCIVPIGQHILRAACEDASKMRGMPCVSVNVSVLQIVQDDVTELTRQVLDEVGLEPSRLKLEVTESVIIGDSERVYKTLHDLKEIGVAVSLDDFGTGYSALSYLTEFDWDELKIDKSFVSKALMCGKTQHVAQTIGSIAEKMNARLVVEGIETSVQRDLFASIGYQVAQGYFYAKPMPYEELNTSPYVLTARNTLPRLLH